MPVGTAENHETGVDLLPTFKLGTLGMVVRRRSELSPVDSKWYYICITR